MWPTCHVTVSNVYDSTCVKPVGNDQQMNSRKDDSWDVQVNIRLKKREIVRRSITIVFCV